jgi:tetratricopeptide (TPR) repeat protein
MTYLQGHTQSVDAQILLARVHIAQGQYDAARKVLEQVLATHPRNPDVLYYLSRLSGLLSEVEFQRLFQVAPNSARAHQVIGEAYEAQNKPELAVTEYQAAVKIDSTLVQVWDEMGELQRHQFNFDGAIESYSHALDVDPRDYISAYGLGAAYIFKQDPVTAVKFLKLAVGIDAQSAAARLALGDALLRAGDAQAAADQLQAAVTLAPEMRQAYTLLARAYRALGRTEAANAALAKSEALNQKEIQSREQTLTSSEKTPR